MGRHLWLMHSLLPLVIGLSTPPKPLPLAERPQAAEQIVTPGAMLAAATTGTRDGRGCLGAFDSQRCSGHSR